MSEYDPITKGLREYIERHPTMTHAVGLADLCDNIDAIHASLERENKEMFDFCDRLKAASEYREDVTLYDVDYVPVPLDKDGVPIHIGDTLEWSDGTTFEVVGIGDGTLYYLDADAEGHISIEWTSTEQKRHVKPDTWERIISDAVKLGFTDPDNEHLADKLVARCKVLCERTREVVV